MLYVFYQADCPSEKVTASGMPGIIPPSGKAALNLLSLSVKFDENTWTALVKQY